MFVTADAICPELNTTLDELSLNPTFKSWTNIDPSIPVANWSQEQQSLTAAVTPLMNSTADALETLARTSSNQLVQDLILLGVQYRRTYVQALPTYQASDQNIYAAGQGAPAIVRMACASVGR